MCYEIAVSRESFHLICFIFFGFFSHKIIYYCLLLAYALQDEDIKFPIGIKITDKYNYKQIYNYDYIQLIFYTE